jgi:hypothetical protein
MMKPPEFPISSTPVPGVSIPVRRCVVVFTVLRLLQPIFALLFTVVELFRK